MNKTNSNIDELKKYFKDNGLDEEYLKKSSFLAERFAETNNKYIKEDFPEDVLDGEKLIIRSNGKTIASKVTTLAGESFLGPKFKIQKSKAGGYDVQKIKRGKRHIVAYSKVFPFSDDNHYDVYVLSKTIYKLNDDGNLDDILYGEVMSLSEKGLKEENITKFKSQKEAEKQRKKKQKSIKSKGNVKEL